MKFINWQQRAQKQLIKQLLLIESSQKAVANGMEITDNTAKISGGSGKRFQKMF